MNRPDQQVTIRVAHKGDCDANRGARRLYKRLGYAEVASRPMVKERWQNPAEYWVLMVNNEPA
jgi:hypothetical protein